MFSFLKLLFLVQKQYMAFYFTILSVILLLTNHYVHANNKSMDKISIIIEGLNDDDCLICLDHVDAAQLKKCHVSCAARFHQACWDKWIQDKNITECPHCRQYQQRTQPREGVNTNQLQLNELDVESHRDTICIIICMIFFFLFLLMFIF